MDIMKRRNFLAFLSVSPLITSELMANSGDFYLSSSEYEILTSIRHRLRRVRRHVGYANFNLITFSDTLYYARNYKSIGAFTKQEIDFIERLFYEDPSKYGFYGKQTCFNIDNKVDRREVVKIPHTGHFLFRGKPEHDYHKIIADVGTTLKLTSGIRNVVKQLDLYVNKIYNLGGNMTKATIQIAPPSRSYHTVSDFDVGRIDWGYKNFTAEFAKTKEFHEMRKLPYIAMRYKHNNKDGVRFEPWHVEVI